MKEQLLQRLREVWKEIDGSADKEFEEGYKAALKDFAQIIREEL